MDLGWIPCSIVDEWLVKLPTCGHHTQRLEDMVGHVLQERLIGHLLQHGTDQRPPVSRIVELCTWKYRGQTCVWGVHSKLKGEWMHTVYSTEYIKVQR